jgi:outer membrane receptor protein involved in Fe transport
MARAKWARLFTTLLFLVLVSAVALAQSLTQGALSGTVTDVSNAVVPNATVTIKSLDRGFFSTTATNAQGVFQFPLIAPGSYSVVVTLTGFKQYSTTAIVNVAQVTVLNARLEVGSTGETVQVSGAAPLMQTETAEMTASFDEIQIENLPNPGNDLSAVAYSAPGVVINTAGWGWGNFSVNGLSALSNVFTIDGANYMDPYRGVNFTGPTNLMLGKNAIEEATVVTNAYGGQYGQQAGAQINYVSKSGSNSFHGNAQYEWTGRYLDANSWFNTVPPSPAPFANNNQWMAAFGGPIRKDKTFFFLDFEGVRYIVPSTTTVYTPTPQFLSDLLNPATGALPGASASTIGTYTTAANLWRNAPGFPTGVATAPGSATRNPDGTYNVNPGSCTDPRLLGSDITHNPVNPQVDVKGLAGAPGGAGCIQSYTTSPGMPAREWLLSGRLDQNLGSADRVFFRFVVDRGLEAEGADALNPAIFSEASVMPSENGWLTWSHVFSGTATNNFIATASYYSEIFKLTGNGDFPYSLFILSSPSTYPLNSFGYESPSGRNVTQYQFVDDFSKVAGRHNLKFGANFRRADITDYNAAYNVVPNVQASLSDFFNGVATYYTQSNPLHLSYPLATGGFGLYAQDEWSVAPRLKLIAGLRAEHDFNPSCGTGCFTLLNAPFSTIEQQGYNAPYGQALSFGKSQLFRAVDAVDWAPRIGFTWAPRANSKTVISGGIGMFYDAFIAEIADSFVNLPYQIPLTLNGVAWADTTGTGAAATALNTANAIRNGNSALGIPSFSSGLTAAQLMAAGGAPPNINSFPGQFRTPRYQEWNLQVQEQLDGKSRITISYAGNHGIHEPYSNNNLNAYVPPDAANPNVASISGYPVTAPDPRFGVVSEWYSGAVSNSNSLIASYNRRLTAGFVINANYTWAHSLDEISNGGVLPYAGDSIMGQINPRNLRANNYGNSDMDIRHSFNASYVWTEPYHFGSRILNTMLGGWTVSQTFTARTGLPFTVRDGTATIFNGSVGVPAQVLGPAQQKCVNGNSTCFNSQEFAGATGLGAYPNQVRNQYRGPGYFDSDFTVGKNFALTERVKFMAGINIYNVLNHPNFMQPGSSWLGPTCSSTITVGGVVQAPSCGLITAPQSISPTPVYGAYFPGQPPGRIGQLQAKITF